MLLLTVFYALLTLIGAQTPKVPNERIFGGESTTIEHFPYQVSLQAHGNHRCGGSIIGTNKVLTAAHCTEGYSASALSVRAGSTYHDKGGVVVGVKSICSHPGYRARIYDNDVSVLTLSSALNFSSSIQPVTLAKLGSSVDVGTAAVVTGWGKTHLGGDSRQLQKVTVPKISQQLCLKYYGKRKLTDSMTCYGYAAGGKDSCYGDSGGPLAVGQIQVGVVSWGIGCARPRRPGVYADISKATIQNHINSC